MLEKERGRIERAYIPYVMKCREVELLTSHNE